MIDCYSINRIYCSNDIKLSIESLLSSKEILKIDKYLYIFHAIRSGLIFDKRYKNGDGFVRLKAQILKNVIGKNYKNIINFLIKNKFIEVNDSYQPNYKSKTFKIHPRYENTKFEIKDAKNLRWKTDYQFSENHLYLLSLLNYLSIDESKIDEINEDMQINSGGEKSVEFAKEFLLALKNKEYHFNVDRRTGRVFNIIVNMPAYLRKYLLFKGEKMQEIDIRASQPLLLNTLYRYWDDEKEVQKFRDATQNEDFYTYLIDNSTLESDRNKAKRQLYYFLFGQDFYNSNVPIIDFFEKRFPVLLDRICEVKRNDHADLPILLQQREADIIIENVVVSCQKYNIPIFPIHDSFLLLRKDVDFVRSETVKFFQEKYNLTPELREK